MRLIIITLSSFALMLSCNPSDNQGEREDTQAVDSNTDAANEEVLSDIDTRTDMNKTTSGKNESSQPANENYTEAETVEEVVKTDTLATNIAYDVNRRTIEQVDTVAATKTYEVKRKIIKKKILVDTVTETVNQEQQVTFEKGDYEVLSEEVVQDTIVKRIDHSTTNASATEQNSTKGHSTRLQPVEDAEPNTLSQPIKTETPQQDVKVEKLSEQETETSSAEVSPEDERKTPSYQPTQSDTTKTSGSN